MIFCRTKKEIQPYNSLNNIQVPLFLDSLKCDGDRQPSLAGGGRPSTQKGVLRGERDYVLAISDE